MSRQIDLCDSDEEISFKDTIFCVSTGFCCMNYMGFCRINFRYIVGICAVLSVPRFLTT